MVTEVEVEADKETAWILEGVVPAWTVSAVESALSPMVFKARTVHEYVVPTIKPVILA